MVTMVFRLVGDVLVAVHTSEPPAAAEWNAFVDILRACDARGELSRTRVLVYTDGGSPNALQRKQITDLYGGRPCPAAIITDSAIARGVVTAMSWFNPGTKAFSPKHVAQAHAYLGIAAADEAAIERALATLRAELAAPRVARG